MFWLKLNFWLKINVLLEAIKMLWNIWQEVSYKTVTNCFRKAGFNLMFINEDVPDSEQHDLENTYKCEILSKSVAFHYGWSHNITKLYLRRDNIRN